MPRKNRKKAVSQKQQMAAGAALSAKRGKTAVYYLYGASKSMHASMSEGELREMAKTKRQRLPKRSQNLG